MSHNDLRYHVWKTHKRVEDRMSAWQWYKDDNKFLKSVWDFWMNQKGPRRLSLKQVQAVDRTLRFLERKGK